MANGFYIGDNRKQRYGKVFQKIIEKIVYGIAALAIVAALAMMIIGAFVNLDKVEKELLSYMPYFYICATIVLLYKIVVLVFTSFYQIKIEKRKDYLDVILALQRAEEASTKQEDMLEQELTPFIENVKRLPEGNTDAVIRRDSRPSSRSCSKVGGSTSGRN